MFEQKSSKSDNEEDDSNGQEVKCVISIFHNYNKFFLLPITFVVLSFCSILVYINKYVSSYNLCCYPLFSCPIG